jgi:AraC-like DNA-binding protein
MEKGSKIYVAGHRGMVGSAIVRELQRQGYTNIITRTHQELDLLRQEEVERFFEEEKPYLKGSLTINDVVAEVFSNKVYISRAISQFTGRNFCQYVNYHRVMYIMDYYRAHPDLKVSDLWPICGFNTIVSFNMAFRLFVGENPSDWCRRERIRMSRKRK